MSTWARCCAAISACHRHRTTVHMQDFVMDRSKSQARGNYLTCALRTEPEETLASSDAGADVEEPQAMKFDVTSVTGCSEAIWRMGVFSFKAPAWSTGAGPSYLVPSATMLPIYPCPRTVVAAKRAMIGSKAEAREEKSGDIATKTEGYRSQSRSTRRLGGEEKDEGYGENRPLNNLAGHCLKCARGW